MLNRSQLSVPGHRAAMHSKALASPADVIMFDLEDSVPNDLKAQARSTLIQTLSALEEVPENKTLAVRINSLDTPFAFRDALEITEAAGEKIDFLVLPKVNHEGDIHFLDRLLSGIEMERKSLSPMGIEASIESPKGLERVSAIAKAGPRLRSLSFGVADYTEAIRGGLASVSGHGEKEEEIYPGHRWHFPLSRMVMAAKANHLLALDAPYGNFKDTEGLARSSGIAKALGCDGKWAIHPDQIPVINQSFSPSPGEIQRAEKILTAVEKRNGPCLGAVAVDGKMVDQASIRLARQIKEQARQLGMG